MASNSSGGPTWQRPTAGLRSACVSPGLGHLCPVQLVSCTWPGCWLVLRLVRASNSWRHSCIAVVGHIPSSQSQVSGGRPRNASTAPPFRAVFPCSGLRGAACLSALAGSLNSFDDVSTYQASQGASPSGLPGHSACVTAASARRASSPPAANAFASKGAAAAPREHSCSAKACMQGSTAAAHSSRLSQDACNEWHLGS